MTEALRMDVEQLREQAGELAIEQHLLLSGWVYGFTDQKIGAVGPAASLNMDIYLPQMMDLGVIATIGKGERSKEAYETIQKHGGVYLTAVGGTGALLSSCIEEWETIAFEDLGDQAIRRYLLKDFPVTVAADSTGRNRGAFPFLF